MRVLLSILITVAVGMGMYVMFMKGSVSSAGGSPMSAISTSTVKMQLVQIAEAEKAYNVENNSYGTIEQLSSGGWLTLKTPDPTHYTYSADPSPEGFRVMARHDDAKGGKSKDYPTMSIDQTGKVQGE